MTVQKTPVKKMTP